MPSFLSRTGLLCRLLLVPLIFPISTSAAQVQMQTPELVGIAHAAIRVSDLAKSREFYEKLGFQEAFAMSQDGKPTEAFLKINDRQFIELYPQRQPSQPIGFMHVCFESNDLEALNHIYLDRGLSPNPVWRAGAGNLLFTMPGPEQQNIEYTQYMPGSKHSTDRGKHLGANRISEQILAVGIEMQDLAAARTFYTEKLGFMPANSPAPPLEQGQIWLGLPGQSGQRVVVVQHTQRSTFQIFFAVADLRRTMAQLKAIHLTVEKHRSALSIQDPDGNRIVFVKAKPE